LKRKYSREREEKDAFSKKKRGNTSRVKEGRDRKVLSPIKAEKKGKRGGALSLTLP